MDYEKIETDLVELLQGNFFEVKALPETEADFAKSFTTPTVFVMYNSSDYTEGESLANVVQEDKIKIGFEIHSRSRRGDLGIFAIQKIVFKKILGYKLAGCDKFQLVSFTPLEGDSPNKRMYYIQFSTTSHISESFEEPVEPLLKQINFIPPD